MADAGSVTVTTKLGALRGKRGSTASGKDYCAFLGIPYARPPVGKLRFKPPQPADKWDGVRDATREGSVAPQLNLFTKQFTGDEDCLFLNVYIPRKMLDAPPNSLLPVMVWIHGGGFAGGSGNADMFGPDYLLEHDVIVVTFNYRLGVLGFASTGDTAIPGNMGLKDQVMALRWVKDNIETFCGDPNNITIFGESAGAMSCHGHMLSPMSKGLFHKAILQSGTAIPDTTPLVVERTFVLAEHLGISSKDSQKVADFLTKVPARTLVEKGQEAKTERDKDRVIMSPLFLPTVEPPSAEGGAFYIHHPIEILKSGNYDRLPFIIGVNSMEGIMFLMDLQKNPNALPILNANFEKMLPLDLPITKEESVAVGKRMKNFYLGDKPLTHDTLTHYCELRGDWMFNYPAVRASRIHASKPDPPVYFYIFSVETENNFLKKMLKASNVPGTCHGDELGYIFLDSRPGKSPLSTEKESLKRKTVTKITTLWTNFAKVGHPTPQQQELLGVVWPAFNATDGNYLDIGNDGLSIKRHPFKDRVCFWDNLYEGTNH